MKIIQIEDSCPLHGQTIFRKYKNKDEYYCLECHREKLNTRTIINKPKEIKRVCKYHGVSIFRLENYPKNNYRCIECRRIKNNK